MFLKGDNISLRALESTDLDLLYSWENDTSIWEVSHTLKPFSKFVLKQYLKSQHLDLFTAKQLRLVVVDGENKPVGLVDLFDFDPQNSKAGIGVLIANSQDRNKGYAKESLEMLIRYTRERLNLHQLYANIGSDNSASIRLFESLNFQKIGVKKDWLKMNGGFKDEILYQLIF